MRQLSAFLELVSSILTDRKDDQELGGHFVKPIRVNRLIGVLAIILAAAPIQVYASKNAANKPFVAIVEFDFYQQHTDSQGVYLPKDSLCQQFEEYNTTNDFDQYATHSLRILQSFMDASPNIAVFPLTIDSRGKTHGSLIKRFYDAFDCLEQLAAGGQLKGVNFSTSIAEMARAKLSPTELASYETLNSVFSARVRNFLTHFPDVVMTMAVGDSVERLEDFYAFPQTSVCNTDSPANLLCVTSFRYDPLYPLFKVGDVSKTIQIGKFQKNYAKEPDGSSDAPLPVTARFAKTQNLIAVGSLSSNTSFLSPLLLGFILENRAVIRSGYGATVNDDASGIGVFPMKYFIVPR